MNKRLILPLGGLGLAGLAAIIWLRKVLKDTFEVCLRTERLGPDRTESSGRTTLRVLVVDDDAAVRAVIARVLVGLGCEIKMASNAREAIAAFFRGSFDLITLDCLMPGPSGVSLYGLLSEQFAVGSRSGNVAGKRLPPVIFITAYAGDPDVMREQPGEGVVAVLRKPFFTDDLARLVRGMLSESQGCAPSAGKGA